MPLKRGKNKKTNHQTKKNQQQRQKSKPEKKKKSSAAPEGKLTSCSHPHSVPADGKSPALASCKWHFIHWKCERCHQCPGLSSLSAELVRRRDAPSPVHARRVIDNNILRGEKAARLTVGNQGTLWKSIAYSLLVSYSGETVVTFQLVFFVPFTLFKSQTSRNNSLLPSLPPLQVSLLICTCNSVWQVDVQSFGC